MRPALPAVIAHRGASARAPENTLAAIREAARLGARWVECDVRLAACGTPVLLHDRTLDRTTNGRGRVVDHPLEALAMLDAGTWFASAFAGEPVPTLEAVLELARELDLGLNVEIKGETAADASAVAVAAQVLLRDHPGPLIVSSFQSAALVGLAGSGLPLGLLCDHRVRPADLQMARELAAVSLHARAGAYNADLLTALADTDLWPVAYTINDEGQASRLWQLGVRSLITDRPDVLLALEPPQL